MIFGEQVLATAADDAVAAGAWLASTCTGAFGTVGGLVPVGFESYLRLLAPGSAIDDWWGEYRELFGTVAQVGERHTDTPDDVWLGVWDGYGFGRGTTKIVWQEPVSDTEREALRAEQARLRDEDVRRAAETSAALAAVPLLHRPHRSYFLLRGSIRAMTGLVEPGEGPPWSRSERWLRPDLCWPADHSWFVGTDVDFWSLYVGGSAAFVADLTATATTPVLAVDPSTRLENED